eukprot:6190029-Pleurochrysis_carterae.AAC.7
MGPEFKIGSREGRRRAVIVSKESRGLPPQKARPGSLENAVTQEKMEELGGAGGACVRGSVATVYSRRAGRLLRRPFHHLALTNTLVLLLPVPTSNRNVLRPFINCRFFAPGNLHRDLDLAAWRPAV